MHAVRGTITLASPLSPAPTTVRITTVDIPDFFSGVAIRVRFRSDPTRPRVDYVWIGGYELPSIDRLKPLGMSAGGTFVVLNDDSVWGDEVADDGCMSTTCTFTGPGSYDLLMRPWGATGGEGPYQRASITVR